jgi:hypothetical protein
MLRRRMPFCCSCTAESLDRARAVSPVKRWPSRSTRRSKSVQSRPRAHLKTDSSPYFSSAAIEMSSGKWIATFFSSAVLVCMVAFCAVEGLEKFSKVIPSLCIATRWDAMDFAKSSMDTPDALVEIPSPSELWTDSSSASALRQRSEAATPLASLSDGSKASRAVRFIRKSVRSDLMMDRHG